MNHRNLWSGRWESNPYAKIGKYLSPKSGRTVWPKLTEERINTGIANSATPRLNDPSWEQFGNDKKNSRSKNGVETTAKTARNIDTSSGLPASQVGGPCAPSPHRLKESATSWHEGRTSALPDSVGNIATLVNSNSTVYNLDWVADWQGFRHESLRSLGRSG